MISLNRVIILILKGQNKMALLLPLGKWAHTAEGNAFANAVLILFFVSNT